MRRDYKLEFILSPEVSEEQTRAILDRVEQVVANYNGEVVRVNQWGRRRLGYPIQHHRDGFYVFINVMILTLETVIELDRTLKVSEEVLRHLIEQGKIKDCTEGTRGSCRCRGGSYRCPNCRSGGTRARGSNSRRENLVGERGRTPSWLVP